MVVNEKPADAYFPRIGDLKSIFTTFVAVAQDQKSFDVSVVVKGGGVTGKTDAVKLGLARALVKMNPEFGPALRKEGLITRDARIKERKKPGLKRARKALRTPSAKSSFFPSSIFFSSVALNVCNRCRVFSSSRSLENTFYIMIVPKSVHR